MAAEESQETPLRVTPFQLLGGEEAAVRRIVDRFYDIMDSDPALASLRAMHAADLTPMRDKLTWFLTGWLGGPPRYAEQNKGSVCITDAHRPFPIDEAARDQWMACMRRALEETGASEGLRKMLDLPLLRMAEFLRNR
ncbi:MAG: group II truncated hemoglobin [Steroidobacteraceae bacterium]